MDGGHWFSQPSLHAVDVVYANCGMGTFGEHLEIVKEDMQLSYAADLHPVYAEQSPANKQQRLA